MFTTGLNICFPGARKVDVMQLSKVKWSLAATLLLGGAYLAGCESHDHDDDHDRRGSDVVIRDNRGLEHRGYYDHGGDWHGGYYDENRAYHPDDRTWGHENDRDNRNLDHHDNSNWDHRDNSNGDQRRNDDDRDRR
jgi:hypothetical protein